MGMTQERYAVGTILGTGAAINVKCGFIPRYVELLNASDSNMIKMEWFKGMAAGYAFKEKTGTAYIARTILTSAGISEYAGSDSQGGGQGFTLGTDSDMNGSGDTIYYLAVR